MSEYQVKLKIQTDASGAITGIGQTQQAIKGLEKSTGSLEGKISQLQNHWLKATAAIAAATYGLKKAWDMVKAGAEYSEQKGILNNLARQYSQTADSIVLSMRKASSGLIANSDLMQTALSGVAKGLKPEQLTNLAGAAKILGDAVGKDATTALQDLTEALETGRTKGLKNYLGSAIDLGVAFGDLESKLTDAEKAQALYSLTMIQATKLQNQQTQEVDDAADSIEELDAQWKNLKTDLALWMKDLAVGIAKSMGMISKTIDDQINDAQKQLQELKDFQSTDPINAADYKAGIEALEEYIKNLKELKAEQEENAKLKTEYNKAKGDNDPVIQYYQNQINALKELIKARNEDEESIKKTADTGKKALEEQKRLDEQTHDAAINNIKEGVEARKNAAEENAKITEDLTDRMKELSLDEYAYDIYLIDKKYEKLKESYTGEIDLAAVKAAEIADIEKRRLEDMTKEQKEAAEKWEDSISDFFESIAGAGEDLEGWWKSWLDRLKGWLFKAIGEMVARWILGVQTMSSAVPTMSLTGVAGGATGGGGWLSSLLGLGSSNLNSSGGFGLSNIASSVGNLFGGITGSFGALGSLFGLETAAGAQLGAAGVGLMGTIGAALPAIGIIAGLGMLIPSLFGPSHAQIRKQRRQDKVSNYADLIETLGGTKSLGDFYDTMVNYRTPTGNDAWGKMMMSGWFGTGGGTLDYRPELKGYLTEREFAPWKEGPFKKEGVAPEEYMGTIAQLDTFLGDLANSLDSTGTVTEATTKAFADFKDEIDYLNEVLPTWGEESTKWGEAMLALYSNLQAMTLDKLFEQYTEGTIAWANALKTLNAFGLTPLETSTAVVEQLLTPLLETVEIGTDRFFEMYQIINMNVRALSDYQAASDRMTTIQKILTSGVELTNEQLTDLVTYYRLLQDVLEGVAVSTDVLNAAWDEASEVIEDFGMTISDVTTALSSWQSMVASIQSQVIGYQLSSSNPQNAVERLNLLKQTISETTGGLSTGAYLSSLGTDAERLNAVSNLQNLYDSFLSLAQEAYQRPSAEYQEIYNSVLNELKTLEDFSASQVSIYEVQVEQLNYLQAIAENTAALNSLPSYQHGVDYVPRTGLALLHQGESVNPVSGGLTVNITVNESKTPGATGQAVSKELVAMLRSGVGRKIIQEVSRRN